MCGKHEFMHNCEEETSRVIGPIKKDRRKSIHEQPIFYFAYDSPLQTDAIDFHRNKSSEIAYSSFVYMLEPRKHLTIREIEDYLQDDAPPGYRVRLLQAESDSSEDQEYEEEDLPESWMDADPAMEWSDLPRAEIDFDQFEFDKDELSETDDSQSNLRMGSGL